MANVFVRSPYYVTSQQTLASNGTATIGITVSSVLRYTITKDSDSTGRVLFEIAELMRDYLEPLLPNENGGYGIFTHSRPYSVSVQHYTSAGVASGSPYTENGIITDGYGYFLDGSNPSTTRGYMQSNDIIYRLEDTAVSIPIDINNTGLIMFLKDGEIVYSTSFSGSQNQSLNYVRTDGVPYGRESFIERVFLQNGIFEENECIVEFFDEFELFDIDEIRIETTDGLKIIPVITLSECRYDPVKVMFFNRFGALQEVWFFRKSVQSLSASREEFKSAVVSSAGSYSVYQHPRSNFNVQSKRKITINTGYVDESYNEIMEEILQSDKVWIEQDTVLTPMIVSTNSMTFKTSVNDKLVDYSLNLDYAYDQIQNIR